MTPSYAKQHRINQGQECSGPSCMKRLMGHKSSSAARKRKHVKPQREEGEDTNEPVEKIQSHVNPRMMGAPASASAGESDGNDDNVLVQKFGLKKKRKGGMC